MYDGPVEKPNYCISGALARDTNTLQGVVLKYTEPLEARKPLLKYRLYVFKEKEMLQVLHIHRQSAYLMGRERVVVDVPLDHPSISKQHAALQFRQVSVKSDLGLDPKKVIKPYLIDLESTNGSFVNDTKIPASRYYELKLGDTMRFGFSTREYVLMTEELDDEKDKRKK